MPSFCDIASMGPDLEMGSLRALILKPLWVCETGGRSGVGYGSFIAPLEDMATVNAVICGRDVVSLNVVTECVQLMLL